MKLYYRSFILWMALGAMPAAPTSAVAQAASDTAATAADSSAGTVKKKKGLLGRVKDVAKDKTVQAVAKTAACTGMVPGASTVAMASGKCGAGGMAGGLAGGGVTGAVMGGAAEAAMGTMGGGAGATGTAGAAQGAAMTPAMIERVNAVNKAIADAYGRGVTSQYVGYIQNDVLHGQELSAATLDDATAKAYIARLKAAKATDVPPVNAASLASSANDLPLLETESAEYSAPVSESTKAILEDAIKQAKSAGIPNSMINPLFADRKRGKGSSTKDLSEGEAREANRGLRGMTLPMVNPGAARASANVQAQSAISMMQQMTAPMGPPATASGEPSGAGGLEIQGDLTSGPVTIRGIVWPDPMEPQDRMRLTQLLASQLAPIASQLNLIGGRFKISLYAPMPSNGKDGLRIRHGMITSALSQAGVRFGETVMVSTGKLEGSSPEQARVEIVR